MKNSVSDSEMDFHAMKRKELQALCKKHKIPANLTNREMADLLALHFQVGSDVSEDKLSKQGPSCLKNLEEVAPTSDDEKLVTKEAKKVRFSPQNETFEFEMTDPRAVRLAGRKKRRKSVIVANNENQPSDSGNPVTKKSTRSRKNVEEKQVLASESGAEQSVSGESEEIPVRTTRSRGKKVANTVVPEKSKPGAEDLAAEKRQMKGKKVMEGSQDCGKEEVPVRVHEAPAVTRRSTRRAVKVIGDDSSKISKLPARNARSARQVEENVDTGSGESRKGVQEVANESNKTVTFQSEAPRKSTRVASKRESIAPGYSKIQRDEDVVETKSRKRPREPNVKVAGGEMKSTDVDLKQDTEKASLRRSRRNTVVAKSVGVTSETQPEETDKNHQGNSSDEIVADKAELGADRHDKRSTRNAITRGKTVPRVTTEKAPVRQSRRATIINKSVDVISETQHEETDKKRRDNTSAEIVEARVELGADRHEKRSTRTATTRRGKTVPAETGETAQKADGEAKQRKRRRDPLPADDEIPIEISHKVEEQLPKGSLSNGSTSDVPMIVEDTKKKSEDGSVSSIVEMEASLSRPALADEQLPEDSNEPAIGSGEAVSKQKKGAMKKSSVRKNKVSTRVSSKSGTSKVDVVEIPVAESKQLPTVLEFASLEVNTSIEVNSQILIQNEVLGVTENSISTRSEGQVADGDVYKLEKNSTEATVHNHIESNTDEKLSGSCNQLDVPSMIEEPVYTPSATLADHVAEHCRKSVSEELSAHKMSVLQSQVAREVTQSSDLVTSSQKEGTSSEFSVRKQTEVLAYEDKVSKEMSLTDAFAVAADCPPAEIVNMMGTGECDEGHSSKEHSSCLRVKKIDVMAEGVTITHNEQGTAKFDESHKSGICQQVEDNSGMVSPDVGARKFDHFDKGLVHVLSENDYETGSSIVEAKLLGMNDSLFHNEPTDVMQPEDTGNETSTTPETSAANDFGDKRYSASRATLADGMASARYESPVLLDQEMSVKTSAKLEVEVGTSYIEKTPAPEEVNPEEILVLAGNAVDNIQVIETEASTGKFAHVSVSREKVEAAEESGQSVWPESGKKLDYMAESSQCSNVKEGRAANFEAFAKLFSPSSEQLVSKDSEVNGVVNNGANEIRKTAAVEPETNTFYPSDSKEQTPILCRGSESSGCIGSPKNDIPEEIFSQCRTPSNGSSRFNQDESNNVNTMVENDGSAKSSALKPMDSENETTEETVSPFEAFQLCTESVIERKPACILKSREEESVGEKPDEPPSFTSGSDQEAIADVTENSNAKLDDAAYVEEPDKDHGSKLEQSATKDGEAELVDTGLFEVEDIAADKNAIAEASQLCTESVIESKPACVLKLREKEFVEEKPDETPSFTSGSDQESIADVIDNSNAKLDDAAHVEEPDKDHGSKLEQLATKDGEAELVNTGLVEVEGIAADENAIAEAFQLCTESVIESKPACVLKLREEEFVEEKPDEPPSCNSGSDQESIADVTENSNAKLDDAAHVEEPYKDHGSKLEQSATKDGEAELVNTGLVEVEDIAADENAIAEAFQLRTESVIESKLACVLKLREEEFFEEKADEPPSFTSGSDQEAIVDVTENSNATLDDATQVEEPDKDHGSKLEQSATKDGEAEFVNTRYVEVEDTAADENEIAEARENSNVKMRGAAQVEEHDKDHGSNLEKSFIIDEESEPVGDDLPKIDEIDADQDAVGETSENLNVKLHEQSVIKDEEAELDDIELVEVYKNDAEQDAIAEPSENWKVELNYAADVEEPDKEHESNLGHSVIKDVETVDVELLRVDEIDADQDVIAEAHENSNAKLHDAAQNEERDRDDGSILEQSVTKSIEAEPAEDVDDEQDAIAEASDNSNSELHDAADVEEPDKKHGSNLEQSVIKDVEAEPVNIDLVQGNEIDADQDAIAEASENSDVELHDAAQFDEPNKDHGSKLEQLVNIELAKANEIYGDEAVGSSLHPFDGEGSGPIDNDSGAGCFGEVFKLLHTIPDPTVPAVRCVESNLSASVSDGQCPDENQDCSHNLISGSPLRSDIFTGIEEEKSVYLTHLSESSSNNHETNGVELGRTAKVNELGEAASLEMTSTAAAETLSSRYAYLNDKQESGFVDFASKGLDPSTFEKSPESETRTKPCEIEVQEMQQLDNVSLGVVEPLNNEVANNETEMELSDVFWQGTEVEESGLVETGAEKSLEEIRYKDRAGHSAQKIASPVILEGEKTDGGIENHSAEDPSSKLPELLCDPEEPKDAGLSVLFQSDSWDHTTTYEGCDDEGEYSNTSFKGEEEQLGGQVDGEGQTALAVPYECPVSNEPFLGDRNEITAHKPEVAEAASAAVMPEATENIPGSATGSKLCEVEMQENMQLDDVILGVEDQLNNEAAVYDTEMELSEAEVSSSVLVGQSNDSFCEGKESEESGQLETRPEKSLEEIRYMDFVKHSAGKITTSVVLKGEDTNGVVEHYSAEGLSSKVPDLDCDAEKIEDAGFSVPFQSDCWNEMLDFQFPFKGYDAVEAGGDEDVEMDTSRISMERDANVKVQEQSYPTGVEESYSNLAPSDAYPSKSDQPAGFMAADTKDIPLEGDKASEPKMKTLQENPEPELKGSCASQNQSRFILIHGTPRKMLNKHDMKENKHGSKMEQMLNVTAVKPSVRRKALQELQKN